MSPQGASGAFEFGANVSMLWGELELGRRFASAAHAGFQFAEAWWPFPDTATPDHEELEGFLQSVQDSEIPLTGLNFFAGDMPHGERGILSNPHRREEFQANVTVMLQIAARSDLRACNALYGQRVSGIDVESQQETAIENLCFATEKMSAAGVSVLVEPLARGLNGDYPLTTASDVAAVVSEVRRRTGLESIGFLYDTFHLASNGEDLLDVINEFAELIDHVQLADAPGRAEPGTGTIDFETVFARLHKSGYSGQIACEYKPTGATETSLGWVAASSFVELV